VNGRKIEAMSLNHWPALTTLVHEGWLLRFADGYTKRANSVSAIYGEDHDADDGDVERRIAWCERRYAALGLPSVVKITPFDRPASLDRLLAERGYAKMDTVSVQTLELARIGLAEASHVHMAEQPTEEWVETFCRLDGVAEAHRPAMVRMLAPNGLMKGFATFRHDGKPVACGLGVVEDEWLGLYDIVTDAAYRNRGIGKAIVANLLYWGKEKGARRAYLAVVADNAPALRLYAKLGFEEAYRYWYRVKRQSD
jgi:GNAT superfamily N-acetyltransferase